MWIQDVRGQVYFHSIVYKWIIIIIDALVWHTVTNSAPRLSSDDSVVPHLLSRVLLLLLLRLRRWLRLGPRHLGQDGGHLLPLVKRLPEVIESQYVLADLLQKTIRKDLVNEAQPVSSILIL